MLELNKKQKQILGKLIKKAKMTNMGHTTIFNKLLNASIPAATNFAHMIYSKDFKGAEELMNTGMVSYYQD